MDSETGTFTDQRDGRTYRTVRIGNQVWLAENLDTKTYRNGDAIAHVEENESWGDAEKGAWCYYGNDPENGKKYGRLYNWYAVHDPRGIAPEGWHVSTDEEWQELEIYLGMEEAEARQKGWRGAEIGDFLKEKGVVHWKGPNQKASNRSGFTALPGGYRDVSGDFFVLGYSGYWWSASEHHAYFAWYRSLYHTHNQVHRTNGYEGDGFSVRCIMDGPST